MFTIVLDEDFKEFEEGSTRERFLKSIRNTSDEKEEFKFEEVDEIFGKYKRIEEVSTRFKEIEEVNQLKKTEIEYIIPQRPGEKSKIYADRVRRVKYKVEEEIKVIKKDFP